jgi:hypothetical protein
MHLTGIVIYAEDSHKAGRRLAELNARLTDFPRRKPRPVPPPLSS